MRYKIYSGKEYKDKYLSFCKKKKENIEKISRHNCSKNIFMDNKYLEKYLKNFFNEKGFPNFTYRDDYQRKHIGFWDKKYFFKEGLKVRYRDSEWVIKINLCKFDQDYDFVVLEKDNKTIKIHTSEIQRVWSIKDFDFSNI